MSVDKAISDHYTTGELLNSIRDSLVGLGKTTDTVTIDDLGPVEEFHIGGRLATKNFVDQLGFSESDHVLDVGCGLGGAARFIATNFKNKVTGIDLTPEYIATGEVLNQWVGLDEQVKLHVGSALEMPFPAESFDAALMLHVGMNIEDKQSLFSELFRVLKPGTTLGVYDIMQIGPGDILFPVPWATESSTSSLASPAEYRQSIENAGFTISSETIKAEFALKFFEDMLAKNEANGGPPPLGLHTLMRQTTPGKLKNMIKNISGGQTAPVEMIAHKA